MTATTLFIYMYIYLLYFSNLWQEGFSLLRKFKILHSVIPLVSLDLYDSILKTCAALYYAYLLCAAKWKPILLYFPAKWVGGIQWFLFQILWIHTLKKRDMKIVKIIEIEKEKETIYIRIGKYGFFWLSSQRQGKTWI